MSATNRRLSFEWALIDSVNDTRRDALELLCIARRLKAHVNLIPLIPRLVMRSWLVFFAVPLHSKCA